MEATALSPTHHIQLITKLNPGNIHHLHGKPVRHPVIIIIGIELVLVHGLLFGNLGIQVPVVDTTVAARSQIDFIVSV